MNARTIQPHEGKNYNLKFRGKQQQLSRAFAAPGLAAENLLLLLLLFKLILQR
jgi:hypothetical protein